MENGHSIRVGTSGYSFEDWRGSFYPPAIDKGKMLDYYAKEFGTVEINSTYYRIPHPVVFRNMSRKVPEGFDFIVKVPQSFTHRRDKFSADIAPFQASVQPLVEVGLLSGLLAQFPLAFQHGKSTSEHLLRVRDAIAPRPLFVEFRHSSWLNDRAMQLLTDEQINIVSVDEPQLPGLLPPEFLLTGKVGYVRLHGRNAEHWYGGGAERYNYLYSEEELTFWRDKIAALQDRAKVTYVFFNNCYEAKAIVNAREFVRMITDKHV